MILDDPGESGILNQHSSPLRAPMAASQAAENGGKWWRFSHAASIPARADSRVGGRRISCYQLIEGAIGRPPDTSRWRDTFGARRRRRQDSRGRPRMVVNVSRAEHARHVDKHVRGRQHQPRRSQLHPEPAEDAFAVGHGFACCSTRPLDSTA